MLSMLTTWIGFAKIEHLFTASRVKDLLSKEDLLGYIVHQYCDANHTPFLQSVDGQLAIVMKGALKLRALVTFLADVVVRYVLKLLLFTSIPAQRSSPLWLPFSAHYESKLSHGLQV